MPQIGSYHRWTSYEFAIVHPTSRDAAPADDACRIESIRYNVSQKQTDFNAKERGSWSRSRFWRKIICETPLPPLACSPIDINKAYFKINSQILFLEGKRLWAINFPLALISDFEFRVMAMPIVSCGTLHWFGSRGDMSWSRRGSRRPPSICRSD